MPCSFKHNWKFKPYVCDCHQKHFDNVILISSENNGAAQIQCLPHHLQKDAPDCGILVMKAYIKKTGPWPHLMSSYLHCVLPWHHPYYSLFTTLQYRDKDQNYWKTKLIEVLLKTASHLGNSLLTSWSVHLNSYRLGSVSYWAQVLRKQWIRNSATYRKLSQHSFQCSVFSIIFHPSLCCPLHPLGGLASLESCSID